MIRKATIHDAQNLVDIAYIVLEELYEPVATTQVEIEMQKKDLCQLIQRDDVPMSFENVYVYEEDGELLGAVWSYDYVRYAQMLNKLYELEKTENIAIPHLTEEARVEDYYIDTVAVLPQARGKSIARKLITAIITTQKQKNVALIVDKEKEIPVHLYKKLGFEIVETNEMYGSVYYYMHYKGEK